MTWFNKFKNVEFELPALGARIDGEFKLVAYKGFEFPKGSGRVWKYPGTERLLMDWNSNLMTNQGLDHYGQDTGSLFQYVHVGTGNATPTNADTSLQTEVASVTGIETTSSAQNAAPYYGMTERKYRFSPGFAGGNVNLNELGVSPDNVANNLGARSLTVDNQGTPTTVTVLSDEYLDVFYRRRNYPAHIVEATGAPTDDSGTVTIEGVSYGYVIRPSAVTTAGSYSTGTGVGWGAGPYYPQQPTVGFGNNIYATHLTYDRNAVHGSVTAWPTSYTESDTGNVRGNETYTASSYNRTFWYESGVDDANFTTGGGGIGGISVKTRLGAYSIIFTTNGPVPKVYGQVFTYYHNFSWNRKNPPWL